MRPIARILCGSHLYGTNIAGSDRDYKIVYIPAGERILLQRADYLEPEVMPTIIEQLQKDAGIEETPDVEFLSLAQYLKLLCEGQTNALDMFFAPRKFYVGDPEPEWFAITNNEKRWISKRSAAFVGYCRKQAGKYSVKLDRYDALKSVVEFFAKVPQNLNQKVQELQSLDFLVGSSEHIEWLHKETSQGMQQGYLSVCQTMVPVSATCRTALDTFSHKLDAYGQRVRSAGNLKEEDWKSLYHAVRVAEEALELLQTGRLTLPRPEKRLLRAIRLGKLPFDKVSAMIEENLQILERAVEESTLPEKPDWDFAEELIRAFYRSAVICSSQS
jgi:hypothetical protein